MTNLSDYFLTSDAVVPYPKFIMQYDGASGRYTQGSTFTATGNKVTVVAKFRRPQFAGTQVEYVFRCTAGSSRVRIMIFAFPSAHATPAYRNVLQMYVSSTGGSELVRISSINSPMDGEEHVVFASYDGDNGLATFYIDGQDEDDTGHPNRTLTTGTLATSGAEIEVSSSQGYFEGDIGFIGMRDAYLTNPSDFSTGAVPKEIDESGWTEWGAQPLFWNHNGDMGNNAGSEPNCQHNGNIIVIPS